MFLLPAGTSSSSGVDGSPPPPLLLLVLIRPIAGAGGTHEKPKALWFLPQALSCLMHCTAVGTKKGGNNVEPHTSLDRSRRKIFIRMFISSENS